MSEFTRNKLGSAGLERVIYEEVFEKQPRRINDSDPVCERWLKLAVELSWAAVSRDIKKFKKNVTSGVVRGGGKGREKLVKN